MSEGIVTKHSTITQVLEDFGNEVLGKLKNNLERDRAIASGALYQKMNFTSTIMGTEFHFVLDMGVDYWKAVDEGRGPTKKAGGNLVWIDIDMGKSIKLHLEVSRMYRIFQIKQYRGVWLM